MYVAIEKKRKGIESETVNPNSSSQFRDVSKIIDFEFQNLFRPLQHIKLELWELKFSKTKINRT